MDIGASRVNLILSSWAGVTSGYLELRSGMWVPVYIVTFCND